jgi:hypothetical protein
MLYGENEVGEGTRGSFGPRKGGRRPSGGGRARATRDPLGDVATEEDGGEARRPGAAQRTSRLCLDLQLRGGEPRAVPG